MVNGRFLPLILGNNDFYFGKDDLFGSSSLFWPPVFPSSLTCCCSGCDDEHARPYDGILHCSCLFLLSALSFFMHHVDCCKEVWPPKVDFPRYVFRCE